MKAVFWKNRKITVFDSVYEPSEDSFLLAKSIKEGHWKKALDLGTGTGIQGINAALLGAKNVLCTDASRKALRNAEENVKSACLKAVFEFRKGNLFSGIGKEEKFGLIIFNPPYVESEKAKWRDLDGGKKGREVIDRFLEQFPKHLEKEGECFFLQSSLNGIKETENALRKAGLQFKIKARKRLFFEELLVFRVWKGKK